MDIRPPSELNRLGKMEWVPLIGTLVGIGSLIRGAIFSPKPHMETTTNLNGRVELWSERKRGLIALIPVIGNAVIIWHDCRVSQELKKLENELSTAQQGNVEQVFSKFPEEVKDSESIMLKLVKINPEILKHSKLNKSPRFMEKVAMHQVANLSYASEDAIRDRQLVLRIARKTKADLFHYCPQLIDLFKKDQEVMVEMALRNPENLQHATELMKDEQFVLITASRIFKDRVNRYHNNYICIEEAYKDLDILQYAPSLCENKDFLLNKAKKQPYLVPMKHAAETLKGDEGFVLDMMKEYPSIYSGSYPYLNQTDPLKYISDDLKNNFSFIEKAMKIDLNAWKFASDDVKNQIFTGKEFLGKYCDCVTLMIEAARRDSSNIGLASHRIMKGGWFKEEVSKMYPSEIYKRYFND